MRPISAGVASGGSLAIALNALSYLERQPDPIALCSALQSGLSEGQRFDWFAYSLGLITGLLIYAALELIWTVRWALVSWVAARFGGSDPAEKRPLYKIR